MAAADRSQKNILRKGKVQGSRRNPWKEDFAGVLTAIKAKWPDRERLALITNMGRSGHYTRAQVGGMIESFDFDDNKVEPAIRPYPKLIDPENFFQALEAIDSVSSETVFGRG